MGVPGYFINLIKQYPNIIKKIITHNGKKHNPYGLYIDGNCGMHPKCFETLDIYKDENISNHDLEELMFDRIIGYFDWLIDYTTPSDEVYIGIDGVAPLAKISQQRKRRFGYANDYRKIIGEKHGKTSKKWSNIVITPGTDFMIRFKKKIEHHYDNVHFKSRPNATYKVIISSYCVPGEGEHKILQHIRNDIDTDKPLVIYGLDADLIFLALSACKDRNIHLLREADQFNKIINEDPDDLNVDMLYVDIGELKSSINRMIQQVYTNMINGDELFGSESDEDGDYDYEYEIEDTDFTMDYIFACYLLGNDFLPHLPSIDIKMNGMNIVLNAYMNTLQSYNSVMISYDEDNRVIIDYDFMKDFIVTLAECETDFFEETLHANMNKFYNRRCYKDDPYEKDIWLVENLKCTVNCFGKLRKIKHKDPVRLGNGDVDSWKFRYYEHYFHTDDRYKEFADTLSQNYIEGLFWVTKYYFEECTNWRWQYKYSHAPFLSDIADYIQRNSLKKINKSISNVSNPPANIYTQLVSVIPNKYCEILPENLRHLTGSINSPIIDMYPIDYKLDTLYKTVLYKCIPDIPYLDLARIQSAIDDVLEVNPYTNYDNSKICDNEIHVYHK
jgi:5'-3' exonuclease